MCEEMAGETYCDNKQPEEFENGSVTGSKIGDVGKPKEYSTYKYSKEIPLAEQNIILKPYQHGISGVASPIIPIKFRDSAEIKYSF
jgi:hypothetical protein